MKELVTTEQAERIIVLLAIALPVIGLLLGLAIGVVKRTLIRGLFGGFLVGLSGPAVLLLWRLYNAIIGVYRLDSVRGLLVNLVLFIAIGLVAGMLVGLAWRKANLMWARRV